MSQIVSTSFRVDPSGTLENEVSIKRLFEFMDEKEVLPTPASNSAITENDESSGLENPSIEKMKSLQEGLYTFLQELKSKSAYIANAEGFYEDLVEITASLGSINIEERQKRIKKNVAYSLFPSSASLKARTALLKRLVVPVSAGSGLFRYTAGDLVNAMIPKRGANASLEGLCFNGDTMHWNFGTAPKSLSTANEEMSYPEAFNLFHSHVTQAQLGEEVFNKKVRDYMEPLLKEVAEVQMNREDAKVLDLTRDMYKKYAEENQEEKGDENLDKLETIQVRTLLSEQKNGGVGQKDDAMVLLNHMGTYFFIENGNDFVLLWSISALFVSVGFLIFLALIRLISIFRKPPYWVLWFVIALGFLCELISLVSFFEHGEYTRFNEHTRNIIISAFVFWFLGAVVVVWLYHTGFFIKKSVGNQPMNLALNGDDYKPEGTGLLPQ